MKFTEYDIPDLELRFTGGLALMPELYRTTVARLGASIATCQQQGMTISISGSQGSGKSTLARHLVELLADQYGLRSALLSLDDFYLTRAERTALANSVHPLLQTRGVPGTHDAVLMKQVIGELRAGKAVDVPRFDKSSDDRFDTLEHLDAVDLVVCEGWCWGATPQPTELLIPPVNSLEREQDDSASWRQYVNEQLVIYQDLFDTDGHIHLQVPSMDCVYRWRWQQEQDLLATGKGDKIMTELEVRAFIAYYERLTRWMLETMPDQADVVIALADDHGVSEVQYR